MKTLYKFQFGNWVTAKNKVIFRCSNNKRILEKVSTRLTGVIIGGKQRRVGTLHFGSHDFEEVYTEQSYLEIEQSVFVYQVQYGFLNKPIECLEEDLEFSLVPSKGLPNLVQNQPAWDERSRQALRNDMLNVPRDSKGRWVNNG